jgi:hypothetical protein
MTRSLELPVALIAFALFLGVAFQTVELVRESQNLVAISHNQDSPLGEAARLKQATESLAGDVAQLAQQGDVSAQQVVNEMAKQNVRLEPGGAAAPANPALATPAQ